MDTSTAVAAPLIALPSIIRLRYGLAAAIAVIVPAVHFGLGVRLPWEAMLMFPLLIAISNTGITRRARPFTESARISESACVVCMFVVDTFCLTGLFTLSGGPTNPFTILYLVHVTLSAAILPRQWTWFLGFLCTVCFGLLFFVHWPIAGLAVHHPGPGPSYHLVGMWLAFAVAAALVAYFSGRIAELLRQHEASLRRMELELARKERLASLVTLAAGAAHELSTPLGTIAVIAKDMELYAATHLTDGVIGEDARLMRDEVSRCREILHRMSIQGAEPMGERAESLPPGELLTGLTGELRAEDRGRVTIDVMAGRPTAPLPRHAVRQAVVALVRNALEASGPAAAVRVTAREEGGMFRIAITDAGPGMSAAELRRIGEPFYTTKPPGKGMGLGVFLVRSLADQIGARLTFDSAPGSGTTAILELPLATRQELHG